MFCEILTLGHIHKFFRGCPFKLNKEVHTVFSPAKLHAKINEACLKLCETKLRDFVAAKFRTAQKGKGKGHEEI
jgi:hypothetical protein